MTKYQPRLDYVLVRIIDVGKTVTGIVMPDSSIEGKES